MFVLYDDFGLEHFESPSEPPNSIEWIDVANEEYRFVSDEGQRFVGKMVRPGAWLEEDRWGLVPVGEPQLQLVVGLLSEAKYLVSSSQYSDLDALRLYVESKLKQLSTQTNR